MKTTGRDFFFLGACAFATTLFAADLSDRYEATGMVTATIDSGALELVSWLDKERRRTSNKADDLGSRVMYTILAGSIGDAGKPANPMIQIAFMMRDGHVEPVDLWLIDGDFMRPLAAGENGGPMSLSGVQVVDGTLSGSFEGELIRYNQSTGQLDTSEPQVQISGKFSVQLPGL